jgi:hypothetical protein
VKEDLGNLRGELVALKEEIRAMKVFTPPAPEQTVAPPAPQPIQPPYPKTTKPSPPKGRRQFPPSVTKGGQFAVPDGIIAHLTKECSGNVHERKVVEVTSGSFGKPQRLAAGSLKNVVEMETGSEFCSAFRPDIEDIPHAKNNWVCYDFKERRIVPTHYAIRTQSYRAGGAHLKSWLVETSADGTSWREVDHKEGSNELNGRYFTGTFPVVGGGECRFIRLVSIGRNHRDNDAIYISAWEIFGSLIE